MTYPHFLRVVLLLIILAPTLSYAKEEAKFGKWVASVHINSMTDLEEGSIISTGVDDYFFPAVIKTGNKIQVILVTGNSTGFIGSPQNMIRIDKNKAHKVKIGPSANFRGVRVGKQSAPLGGNVLKELLAGKKMLIQVAIYGFPEIPTFEISLDRFKEAYNFLQNPKHRKKVIETQKKEHEEKRKAIAKKNARKKAKREAEEKQRKIMEKERKAQVAKQRAEEEKRMAEENEKKAKKKKQDEMINTIGGIGVLLLGK